tara:strand:+ start:1217 stop:1897 length:681 start_codon:yes stop_codon:yes gene_type:complete
MIETINYAIHLLFFMTCMFKYKFFVFVVFLFCLDSADGQNFNVGGIVGVNASQISGDGLAGFNKGGLLLGAYVNADINPKINAQFEIVYSEKGSRKLARNDKGDTESFLLRMNYVEIPLMIRLKNNKFTYDVGTYYGRLVHLYLEDENGPFEIPEQLNQFKKDDFGALIGINFNFNKHFVMNWRISNSVLAVRKHDSGENFRFNNGMFHTFLSFSMRYEIFEKNGS